MSGEETEGLPGEAWRGTAVIRGQSLLCSVAPDPEQCMGPWAHAWVWLPWADPSLILGRWRRRVNDAAEVFRAAFVDERTRANAATREADRLRHGVPVEGDYVCPDALRADAAETRIRRIEAFMALDGPWPTTDVLRKLADAADHMLRDHSYDVHGHELIAAARDAARGRLAFWDEKPT